MQPDQQPTPIALGLAIVSGAEQAIRQCLGVQPGEKVLVICDPGTETIGEALYRAALGERAEALLMRMETRQMHGQEPPEPVAAAMAAADVVLGATSKSLTHTAARRQACEAGARVATLPDITEEVFARGLNADYDEISHRSSQVAERLTAARAVRITTQAGMDLTFSVAGHEGEADTGLYLEPGDYGNLPAGEAAIGPIEGSSNGMLVIDGSMAGIGLLSEPLRLKVEAGFVTEIDGGEEAERLRGLLMPYGQAARNIAEFGVGANQAAILTGTVLEDEKILGTIHIALGNNMSYGGNFDVPLHLDGVILRPTVEMDGELLLKDGNLKL